MKRLALFCLCAALMFGAAGEGQTEEIGIAGEFGIGVLSSFVWRGKVVSEGFVIQPDLTVVSVPWTVNVWGSWDWETQEDSPVESRIDVSILYDHPWRDFVFGLGVFAHIYHDSPSGAPKDTYEGYVSVAGNVPLDPVIEIFYDFGSIEGTYIKVSAGYSYPIADDMDVELRLGLGGGSSRFTEKFYGARMDIGTALEGPMDVASFADFTARISATLVVGAEFAIVPSVEYVALLDRDLKASALADGDDAENLVGSLAVKWFF